MRHYNPQFNIILLFICSFISPFVLSNLSPPNNSLQQLLRYALQEDPLILEAKANVSIAEAKTKIAKSGHYPILSLVNTQVLSQSHHDSTNIIHSRPSLKGQINLYHWGAIQYAVERESYKEDYFKHKIDETKEHVGKLVIDLYLKALYSKEMISIHSKNLNNYKNILKKVQIIAKHDSGRESEITLVESRLLKEQSIISQQNRILNVTLSQLNRYSKKPLTENDLDDPFITQNVNNFILKYRNPDLEKTPTYQAQRKELDSSIADTKAAKAKLFPALNLEGELYNKGYNISVGVSWNIIDLASVYNIDQSSYTEDVANAKLQEVLLELKEQARSSKIDMEQSSHRLSIIHKQEISQKKVIQSTELQFDIAQRSLLDILNAYQDLSDIKIEESNARNDYRIAALNYLVSQARIVDWAGIKTINLNL